MTPVFSIEADSRDITDKISQYLSSLRLTDGKGYESDTFEMTLADPDRLIDFPEREVELSVAIGYQETGLIYKGLFVTDEAELSGVPDQWTVRARAADMNGELKGQKSKSWRDVSLGALVRQIAQANGLQAAVSERFDGFQIAHIDQTYESDLHFLTRLAKRYDAVAKVAGGKLLFTTSGAGLSASGLEMPFFEIAESDCASFSVVKAGKPDFTGVAAFWHDYAGAEEKQALVGSDETVKVIKRKFPSQAEAQNAAEAEFARLKRSKDTASLSLRWGRPELTAEARVRLSGFRRGVPTEWVIGQVVHELSKSSGLSSSVSLEKAQEAGEFDLGDFADVGLGITF